VCFVTRGPGATNASIGVHTAFQDSTPMVLFIGQVASDQRDREAFQELDYRQMFGPGTLGLAKWAAQVDSAERLPEYVARAFRTAMQGRPGPVVLALPEDVLRAEADVAPGPRVEVAEPAPAPAAIARLGALLADSERPVMILGGSRWTPGAAAAVHRFAAAQDLPTAVSFRRQRLFDALHPAYAGDVGLAVNPRLRARIAEADLVILLGARFGENPSQGYALLDIPGPRQRLVHVHPGAEEIGRVYAPTLGIVATPGAFLEAAAALPAAPDRGRAAAAHADYLAWSEPPAADAAAPFVDLSGVVAHLRTALPPDAILTNGAGNYAGWAHRFHRYRGFGSQLAPTSGSMGYGLPAAIAAKLRRPAPPVVCLAGDGCFQMTMQEFGTAAETGAAVVVLVIDNGLYGTIRMHQEREHPGRPVASSLRNPDFAALARAYGCFGERVERTADFPAAFVRAMAARGPALLHLITDPERITPTTTLTALRAGR
jgi:acetolactate synthase-1/2/3 large subunit